MKRDHILFRIIKMTGLYRYIIFLVGAIFFCAWLMLLVEPSTFTSYGESLWYCFVSCATIGFGDIVAQSFAGRIITVVLYLIVLLAISLITGVIVSYYTELIKARNNESLLVFMDKLEHLPELSKEDLQELSEKVINYRKHRK